ncbi:MAG: glycosyltransferase family 4 protein [Gemmatimonadota bacterium]
MRVALFTRYGMKGASSRVRSLQFLPWLRAQGVEVEPFPLLDDGYLEALYTRGRRPLGSLVTAYIRRVRQLRHVSRATGAGAFHLTWVEKELLPWLPFAWENRLLGNEIPVVADYDDAIFHQYDQSPRALVRLVLADKIDRIMAHARVVTVGNEYLAGRARDAGARQVEVLPSVVPMERYPEPVESSPTKAGSPADSAGDPFVLGWIGTPITARYLRDIAPVLAEVTESHGVSLRTVGSGPLDLPGVSVDVRPWTLEDEGAEVAGFHAGIMPLRDGPWERGKCGYKLVQYMAAGRPVVASSVGAARDIVVDGETGFLVRGPGEWARSIRWLVEHPDEARVMGMKARERARALYSVEAVAPHLLRIFQEAIQAA